MLVGAIVVIVLLAAVVWLVSAPLRRAASGTAPEPDRDRPGLEAAKEAKYREIRDAEMDHLTGKLSVEDHRRLDRVLRAEAVELLRRLDELGPAPQTAAAATPPPPPSEASL